MYEIGDKRTKQICKWIASVLTVALIFNESGIPALAAEIQEAEGFIIEAEAAVDEEQPAQAETQEQQEGYAQEMTVQEPVVAETEVSFNQESGVGDENIESVEEAFLPELNNTSYAYALEVVAEVAEGVSESEAGNESDMSASVENSSEENASDGSESSVENESSSGAVVVVSRTADVVFVIDVSGSMSSYIAKVKAKIGEFIESLNAADVNVRIKFVLYSDVAYNESTVCSGWCSNVDEAINALNSITMLGGGDGPETALDGMGFMFQDDFGWRESVAKFSILLTDAAYKTDNTFDYTFDDITDELVKKDIVSSAIVPSTNSSYDNWIINGGKKGDITSDYSFLLEWVDEMILPNVDKKFQNVTIEVKKDNVLWEGHGKEYILENKDKGFYVKNFNAVENGMYQIYEVAQDSYLDTGMVITVDGEDITDVIDYYTVFFCDGDNVYDINSEQAPQIVVKGQRVSRPNIPIKAGYTFNEWMTENNGTTAFNFSNEIHSTTIVYAGWIANTYSVDIKVQKDSVEWGEHGRIYFLKKRDQDISMNDLAAAGVGSYMLYESDGTDKWITDLTVVGDGIYDIYDVTNSSAVVDTGVTVVVNGDNAEATIDYYTVTFHDGDTVLDAYSQIVLKNKEATTPFEVPSKEGYTFYRWSLFETDDDTAFNFATPIKEKTDLYAKWNKIPEKTFTISVSVGAGGKVLPSGDVTVKSGDSQQFVITPDEGYQIDAVLVDNAAVTLNNARFLYRTLSGSVGTEQSAILPATTMSGNDTAAINLLSDDNKAKEYLFENVTSDHTLSVTFKVVPKKRSKKSDTSDSDDSPSMPSVIPAAKTDTQVILDPVIVPEVPAPASKDSEPKTGDVSNVEVYATIGMIAGLSYLLLYFLDGESGMTEEEKKEIVGALVKWARKGKRFRKYVALAIVFVILVYYHSIGKRTTTEWKELCE